ncbi:uncharacterized protein LOC128166667 [Crassostrea angulata]|nr:uncharacterized protein LOC105325420 [Crassostrea gigas]XP_034314116.1 uncharacterized protein LOC105325420 [Crassostrea gigas]XP_052687928.1 uncharacterized protein LOC128166667 [Crassostrea angulata]XP_052687929.1 uncharacterized protein LOC128166667 [Crassostrea angulata]|eukprot:XP_011423275.1 PREDICTED: uncharacterized protein LOC105325420 [Crassostrea gigas]
MAELRIQFSLSMIIAGILAEVVSVFWYNHHSPWGRRSGDRYMLAAIVCDAGLVIAVKFIMDSFWSVSRWEDAFVLALTLAAIFGCLEGPHMVHDSRSFSWFFFHTVHKFLVVFVIAMALVYFSYLG